MKYRIRELREAKMIAQPPRPMTLDELAEATGLSIGLLSAVERGQQTTTRTLERIAHALGVRVTDLMDERVTGDGSPTVRSAKTGRSGARTRGKDGRRGGNRAAEEVGSQGGAGSDLGEDGRPGARRARQGGES